LLRADERHDTSQNKNDKGGPDRRRPDRHVISSDPEPRMGQETPDEGGRGCFGQRREIHGAPQSHAIHTIVSSMPLSKSPQRRCSVEKASRSVSGLTAESLAQVARIRSGKDRASQSPATGLP